MRIKRTLVPAMAAALMIAASSCGTGQEPAGPETAPTAEAATAAAQSGETETAAATAASPEPAYEAVTFAMLAGDTAKEGHASVTGYACAEGGHTVLRDLPGICGAYASPAAVSLPDDGRQAPAGRLVTVEGALTENAGGWTLTADRIETAECGWNRLAELYALYAGQQLADAYAEFDSQMVTLCTWQYMLTGEGTPLTPEQALEMLGGFDAGTFADSVAKAAPDCGEAGSILAEYAEASRKTAKKALKALKDGRYEPGGEDGAYAHPGGADYGGSYGEARQAMRGRLAGALRAE